MSTSGRRLSLRCFRHQDVVAAREMMGELEPRRYFTALTIAQENALPGTPQSVWDVSGVGDTTIQGFATDISVNVGQTVSFKITDTKLASYHIDIYRLGYYQGNGARLVATIATAKCSVVDQPDPLTDSDTGLVDCGNWSVTASWAIPADATSGVYFARVTRNDTGGASQIPFIVRNDASHSEMVFQTADETWEAYNDWGGNSLYQGGPVGRAYEVSYNRPFNNRADHPQDYLFGEEYPMIRFLEQNGYDVTYVAGVDAERNPATLLNHKAYLSVGHDEYWSGNQYANVEAARDQGLNIAFFSGNEVYWKTRFDTSLDTSKTPYRTLVCYKESLIGSDQVSVTTPVEIQYTGGGVQDPSGIWTGLWRDLDNRTAGAPDQQMTGQLFSVNRGANGMFGTAIQVPSTYAALRIWRNTSVAQLQPGQVATLAQGTLGYEWDEDVDTASRPAGLIDMSSTTEAVPQKLVDTLSWPNCGGVLGSLCAGCHGCMVAPATATHSITEYRTSSGSLVFDAGSVQWSWGLDGTHDGGVTTASKDMQQATVNLLADMHATPKTLMAGLVAAAASTDTLAPTAVLTPPLNGVITEKGGFATITGTATDAGGGVVASVEVSIDGGKTWHQANGTGTWSYTWSPTSNDPVQIETRATDDSVNLSAPSGVYNAALQTADNSLYLWSDTSVPAVVNTDDPNAIEVGMKFKTDVGGTISAIRFYKGSQNTGTHVGHLWTDTGQLLATVTFSDESASGWQTAYFSAPIAVQANTIYVVSYHTDVGYYSTTANQFAAAPVDHDTLHGLSATDDNGNGMYVYGASAFPKNTFSGGNYWVDAVFNPGSQAAPVVPTVIAQSPRSGATDVSPAASISAQFNESIDRNTLSFVLTGPSGAVVPTSLIYSDTTRTATITPLSALAYGATYTVTVYCSDTSGTPMTTKYNWTFNTVFSSAPSTIFPATATPDVASTNDTGSVELGVKFQSDLAGYITGVRFYKGPGNTGTHTGSLWSSSGKLLATGTFTNETAGGWQTLVFATPVAIAANTTYVASYHTNVGGYSLTASYFTGDPTSGTLHALADGSNGVYGYGAGGVMPTSSYNATNYWVDAVFTNTLLDLLPPTVSATTPGRGAGVVSTQAPVTATFSENIEPSSLSFTLRDANGQVVPAYVTYDAASNTATLTPAAALSRFATYSVSVSAMDKAGNAMAAPVTWSFTTGGASISLWNAAATPATADANDSNAVELGTKFRSDAAGYVTGVRFYKGATNTGAHTGSLWSSTGQLLATGTFGGETASGWQTLYFSAPVQIAANTTYVVSYHTNVGQYALTASYFATSGADNGDLHGLATGVDGSNGVYVYGAGNAFPANSYSDSNYWVDPIFTYQPGTTPITVVANGPTSSSVPVGTAVTVTFNEPIDPGASSLSFVLRDSSGQIVSTSQSYNAATHALTLTPLVSLLSAATYTATVSGAQDFAGDVLATPFSWTFTTSSAGTRTQTTAGDFGAGTAGAGVTVTNVNGGEVRLAQQTSDDFTGAALGSAWTWTSYGSTPTAAASVGNSVVSVGGGVITAGPVTSASSFTATAAFGGTPWQHLGLSTSMADAPGNYWAVFSTLSSGNTLYARVNVNGVAQDVSLGSVPTGFHAYRIQPVSGGFAFYVDDVLQTTINATIPTNVVMSALFSDYGGTSPLKVDSVAYGPFASGGTFTSAPIDAGRVVSWDAATWTASMPPGTSVTVQVAGSNDGATFSDWQTVGNGSAIGTGFSYRYLIYRITLTTNDPTQSPAFSDITLAWH